MTKIRSIHSNSRSSALWRCTEADCCVKKKPIQIGLLYYLKGLVRSCVNFTESFGLDES